MNKFIKNKKLIQICDTVSMIIYENTVNNFVDLAMNPRKLAIEIKGNLYEKFGIRVAENEFNSWTASLPEVAKLIKGFKTDKRKVLIEFNVPTSKQRIDFILLGKNKNGKSSAWLLELKQWSQVTEEDWNEFRVGRYIDSHPSDQASKYTERLNHEMGLIEDIEIKSGAFLHNLKDKKSPLYSKTYNEAIKRAKLYSFLDKDKLSEDMNEHTIIRQGEETLEYFKSAKWSPTKHFQEQMMDDFKSINLVGTQKLIYEKIENFVKKYDYSRKMTFIVSGDPGSGKTIIAFKLLVLLLSQLKMKLQLMIPGQELRKAFKYNIRDKKAAHLISGSNMWKDYEAALIDEAHKAIGRDTGTVNYNNIYKTLKFGIIFIDNDQVINRKGVEKNQIIDIAKAHNHIVHEYNIDENFRNKGERTLIDWIDTVIYKKNIKNGEFEYYQDIYMNKNMNYKLSGYKTSNEFIKEYFKYKTKDKDTRITSLWHKEYHVGPANKNGEVPRKIKIGNENFVWNPNEEWWKKQSPEDKKTYNKKVASYAQDRKLYLTGNPEPEYLAYFNHIQGYEFNNIFVYIPKVLTFEKGEIIFHRDRLAKEVKTSQTWSPTSKSKELNDRDPYILNKKYFLNRIKVMLTRGTKSTHVFAEDKKLNEYLFKSIKK